MKQPVVKILTLSAVFILTVAFNSPAIASGNRFNRSGGITVTAAPLSAGEISYLTLMREEEKLARDVYLLFYEAWELPIFKNITASEQSHMDAVKMLLDKYGISDPALAPGEFTPQSGLQPLYDSLTAQGLASIDGAYSAGVAIEEEDISDLQAAIAASTHQDIIRVYNNLLQGSLRHLAAFTSHQA